MHCWPSDSARPCEPHRCSGFKWVIWYNRHRDRASDNVTDSGGLQGPEPAVRSPSAPAPSRPFELRQPSANGGLAFLTLARVAPARARTLKGREAAGPVGPAGLVSG